MHAAHLVRALQQLRQDLALPPAIVEGNGSRRMEQAGVHLIHNVATWSEMGIIHNALKAQFFHRMLSTTARYILSNQPDMVVLVDNRVLNLSLAKYLRTRGYTGRIVYYVAPVRWESLFDPREQERSLHNRRFLDVKQYCDFAIPIYPVSLETYAALHIPHEFPGHPLCELARPQLTDAQFSALTGIEYDPQRPPLIIGALVGSRRREIEWIAPAVYRALALIQAAFQEDGEFEPPFVVSSVAHPELMPGMLKAAQQAGLADLVFVQPEHIYDVMSRAQLMIVKSGTGLHECVLLNVPTIACYRVPALTATLIKHVLRFSMPFYTLPNLLAGRAVVPELIQDDCTHTRLAELAGSLLFEAGERQEMLKEFAALRALLCKPQALKRAANLVQQLLQA